MRRIQFHGPRPCAVAAAVLLAAAAPPPVDPPLPRLKADAEAARTFDYWRLREGRTPEALRALSDGGVTRTSPCRTPAEQEIAAGLETAADTPSHDQWRDDRAAAAVAWRRYDVLKAKLLGGEATGDPALDDQILPLVARARTARTPRLAALYRRTALDQTPMAAFTAAFVAPLSEGAQVRLFGALEQEECRNAVANAAWLKQTLTRGGWFTIARDGAEADDDAWVIAQHADHDPALQRAVLARLERLVPRGETRPQNYALLFDRVATNAGRPQRYGSQGDCRGGKRFTAPLEDPAGVDARRAKVGLGPLAAYEARVCRGLG